MDRKRRERKREGRKKGIEKELKTSERRMIRNRTCRLRLGIDKNWQKQNGQKKNRWSGQEREWNVQNRKKQNGQKKNR